MQTLIKRKFIFIIEFAIISFAFSACSPTKYIPKGDYLLKDYKINVDNKEVLSFDLDKYVRQKPNKKIFKVPIYARIYNIINPEKEALREAKRKPKEVEMNKKRLAKGKEPKEKFAWSRWLLKIGEEPIVYSTLQTNKSSNQIQKLLNNKGYYDAKVTDSVKFNNKRASVKYNIITGEPFRINQFKDSITDESIKTLIYSQLKNYSLKEGEIVDVKKLSILRDKINELLLNNGYFKFSKAYISYQIDTLIGNHQADIILFIKNPINKNLTVKNHQKYYLNKFYIYPDYEPEQIIQKTDKKNINYDTLKINPYLYFLINKKNSYTKSVLTRGLAIDHDSLYRANKLQETFRYYSTLSNFRLINIDFNELNIKSDSLNKRAYLNTNIKLTPSTPQSIRLELEGNTTSGKYGMGTNLNYRHLNLFGGAEILDLKFKVELNNQDPGVKVTNSYFSETEYSLNATIRFPNLIAPFKTDNLYKRYFPKTSFSAGYKFRYNTNYRRYIISTSYGYDWKSTKLFTHQLNLIEFNSIKMTEISAKYLNDLFVSQQFNEKYDHIILGSSYSGIYNTQNIKKFKNFVYFRTTFDWAGNLLFAINKIFDSKKIGTGDYLREVLLIQANDHYKDPAIADSIVNIKVDSLNKNLPRFYAIRNIPYAQYFKTELDFRFYNILDSRNELVYRINPGIIYPYGNSYYTPQEKQFYLGGASSMRAWQARTLGPGSFAPDSFNVYQYGDLKIELNVEYRFKMFWLIEGALFADAGNIWIFNKYSNDPRKTFKLNRFYKEIALGTGIGFRFDFSFFVFRFDFGFKIHDPSLPEKKRWIGWEAFKWKNKTFNFGIGYPF